MYPGQLLDPIPIPGLFVLIVVVLVLIFELGYRVGRWWQNRTPEETEGPTGTLVGSLLALLAFLLAITMGMASDRFDTRRGLVLDEANAIGTTYLRAGYLPAPVGDESRALLREYVPLRINVDDRARLAANFVRSEEIHAELWAMAEQLGRDHPDWDVIGLYIDSLNETIDLHSTRETAIIYARVPETILFLLIIGAALTLGMVGYSAGLTRRRSPLSAVVLVVVLAAVLTLVVDLDRPRNGFLQVSQQPLIDLAHQLGRP
jgi:protein-S-isoprenylcysteine O-methyltransferase Ste14